MEEPDSNHVFGRRFILYFAAGWSIVAIAYIFAITFIDIPEANQRYADTILGFLLGTVIAQVMGYIFGSSLGSQKKDETIASIAKQE